jgi:nitrogen fixation NifU-like protein
MDLGSVYQEIILEHYRGSRFRGELEDPDVVVPLNNPTCGDDILLQMKLRDGRVEEIRFSGNGCAISQASASMMTDCLKGRTKAEAEKVADAFQQLVTDERASLPEGDELVEKLEAFAGVREFPSRVKCASLAWHALRAALEHPGDTVTTE